LSLAGVAAGVWRDTRAHEDGLRALATAAEELVERGDLEQAQAAYGRASQLLRDGAAVDAARAHHAVLAFDRWYPDAARRDWLQRLLASVPVPARDAAWHERHRRWQGVARCTLHGHLLDGETSIGLLRLRDAGTMPAPWPQDGVLDAGHYVVQVERVGLATANVAFEGERDRAIEVEVPQLHLANLREGEVLVAAAGAPERAFALSRTELSGAEAA